MRWTSLATMVALSACSVDDTTDPGTQSPTRGDTPPADDPGTPPGPNGPLTIAPGPSRGSPIAISADDSVVVVTNRDASTITVYNVAFSADGASAPTLAKTTELEVGAEPWQVAIAPNGESAYVVLRKDQKLAKVSGLKTTPKVDGYAVVGSEPTAVALTPGGTRAWVANWVDGTLTGVDTAKMEVKSTIDLNAALVGTRLVGDIKARPALAHPRSIAITNDGNQDESDESIYVTEYYAQRVEAEADNGANADTAKAGLVYKVKLSDKSVSTIRLAALADIGFKDSNGGTAGCYPNQLQSITIQDKYAYVSSICASPKGPVGATATTPPNLANIKTTTHGVVSVIDLTNDTEVTQSTATLHAKFDKLYADRAVTDDGTRRYPAVPVDIGFVKGGGVSYVVANAADAVFRVRYDLGASSSITELATPSVNFINLGAAQNPIGIATPNVEAHKRYAFVANDITRNVSILDFNTQAPAGDPVTASALPSPGSKEDHIRKGRRFFNTATGRWSLKGQGWNGCQSCHADGLSDNVTWFFARGPRQSTSLDGSFNKKDPTDQRIFNWTGIVDEVADFENNTRGISGGVGAIVSTKSTPPQTSDRIDLVATGNLNLSGSAESAVETSAVPDWSDIKAYMQSIRSPRKPSTLDGAKIAEGRTIFSADGSCQGCHGGDKWTISTRFYTPSADTNNYLLSKTWTPPTGFPTALLPASDQRFMRFQNGNATAFDQLQCILRPVGTFAKADDVMGQAIERRADMTTPGQGAETNGNGFNPPSLLGMQVGAPYFHGGGAATLESLFSATFKTHYQALAPNLFTESDPDARAAKVESLVQFLLSIDAESQTVQIPAPGTGGGDFCSQ